MTGAYAIGGGKLCIKKYKMSATTQNEGIVMLRSAANAAGQISISTTTSLADALGLLLDTGVYQGAVVEYSTVQGDPEGVASVIINPDLVLRALLVDTAANGAQTQGEVTTAASNGLSVTSTTGVADYTSPQHDEGLVWYTSGGAASQSRKITSTAATALTVLVPFAANAVGDTFLATPSNVGLQTGTLSTDLLNFRADLAPTGAALSIVDFELNGATSSYVHFVLTDHSYAVVT
jgi:hypothetical protein